MRTWFLNIANRLRLTLNFFHATGEPPDQIHQCEFYFIYRDGDRSPFGRSIFGSWKHETDQPDEIATVPRSSVGGGVMGSYHRRALVLGRRDAREDKQKRSVESLLDALGCETDPGLAGVDIHAMAWELLFPAYSAAFEAYPNFAPSHVCVPWSKAGRDIFSEPVSHWNGVRDQCLQMTDEELGLLAQQYAIPSHLGATLKIALRVMTQEWVAASRPSGGSCKGN